MHACEYERDRDVQKRDQRKCKHYATREVALRIAKLFGQGADAVKPDKREKHKTSIVEYASGTRRRKRSPVLSINLGSAGSDNEADEDNKMSTVNEKGAKPDYLDFDKDGDLDIIAGGNLYNAKPEIGRYDASFGLFLENDGRGKFEVPDNGYGFKPGMG